MIASPSTLEDILLHGYRAQLERRDDRAVAILTTAQADAQSGSAQENHWTHDLHACLQEAAALDAAMAQDVAAWRDAGRSPIGPLKEVLECLAQRIRILSEEINRRVSEMRTRKQGLVSEIDEFIQNRRMLQAYVKHG